MHSVSDVVYANHNHNYNKNRVDEFFDTLSSFSASHAISYMICLSIDS